MTSSNTSFPFLGSADDARPALMDDASNVWLSYGDLKSRARQWYDQLPRQKCLVFQFVHNDIDNVAALLGSLAAGHAVVMLDPALSADMRQQLIDLYQPGWIINTGGGLSPQKAADSSHPLHDDLSVLLSTSGSTGSPKLVRLSLDNLCENARAVADVLDIGTKDVACGHLPLHYSFGLSVLTTHLLRGARIRLTKFGFTDREFWAEMRIAEITHLPGVPFHFQMMQKLGYRRLNIPSVKSLAQAGGGLNIEARQQAYDFMEVSGGRFYVMYGQTEASPRMTTLTHGAFEQAPASVGCALPGCDIAILAPDRKGRGEVEFRGPNVMMGYAECRADLGLGDELGGRLRTGDIGVLDDDGILTLTGRSTRFGKVYGLRINLDEVEACANSICDTAVTQQADSLVLHMMKSNNVATDADNEQKLMAEMKGRYTLPTSVYQIRPVDSIPRTDRGKIDYASLDND